MQQNTIITASKGAIRLLGEDSAITVRLDRGESVRVWARERSGDSWETIHAIKITNDPSRGWMHLHNGNRITVTITHDGDDFRIESDHAEWKLGDVIRRYKGKPCGWDGWTEHPNGDRTFWTDDGETSTTKASALAFDDMGPLVEAHDEHSGASSLGMEHWRWPMHLHCDPSMPMEDRERIASLLETAGDPCEFQPKGEVGCSIEGCREILLQGLRELPGDRLANTSPLIWPTELAHYVRSHGLRISPRVLMDRFGVRADGTRPAIA